MFLVKNNNSDIYFGVGYLGIEYRFFETKINYLLLDFRKLTT